MDEPTRVLGLTERARQDTVATLRRIADELEAAPLPRAIEALHRLGTPIAELDRTAALWLGRS